MKTLLQLSVLPALGFVLLSGDVHAVTASAAFCKPIIPSSSFVYSAMGFANLSAANPNVGPPPITCLIPMDDAALGSNVSFQMRVYDNSVEEGFSCQAVVANEIGASVVASSSGGQTSTTEAFQGSATFSWSVTVSGTNVNTNMYAITCSMPGNFSVIYSARAQ